MILAMGLAEEPNVGMLTGGVLSRRSKVSWRLEIFRWFGKIYKLEMQADKMIINVEMKKLFRRESAKKIGADDSLVCSFFYCVEFLTTHLK